MSIQKQVLRDIYHFILQVIQDSESKPSTRSEINNLTSEFVQGCDSVMKKRDFVPFKGAFKITTDLMLFMNHVVQNSQPHRYIQSRSGGYEIIPNQMNIVGPIVELERNLASQGLSREEIHHYAEHITRTLLELAKIESEKQISLARIDAETRKSEAQMNPAYLQEQRKKRQQTYDMTLTLVKWFLVLGTTLGVGWYTHTAGNILTNPLHKLLQYASGIYILGAFFGGIDDAISHSQIGITGTVMLLYLMAICIILKCYSFKNLSIGFARVSFEGKRERSPSTITHTYVKRQRIKSKSPPSPRRLMGSSSKPRIEEVD